jgi:farnesyl diphosphate synthase
MPSGLSHLLEDHLTKFIDLISFSLSKRKIPDSARLWILKCIDYNLQGGKMTRGRTFLYTLDNFLPDFPPNSQSFLSLAWCIELLQAFFLIADDIMDSSPMRRNRICWHKLESIGLSAINDVLLLQTVLYILLFDIVSAIDGSLVLPVQMLFQEITLKTEIGQFFDLNVEKETFSWDRAHLIAEFKTAYYSFYLPVALGLVMTKNERLLEEAEQIFIPLGVFFQAQDDYLDFYGNPQVMGKIGTDIEEGKCSWLYLKALEILSEQGNDIDISVLKENYGKKDSSCVLKVREIFKKCQLDLHFKKYEEKIEMEMENRSVSLELRPIFEYFCSKIFNRSK